MNPVSRICIFLIRVYQRLLSPVKMAIFGPPGACRFSPSCSEYAAEALQTHGLLRGAALSARRLCRCHPWGGCGYDPVPPAQNPSHCDCPDSRATQGVRH